MEDARAGAPRLSSPLGGLRRGGPRQRRPSAVVIGAGPNGLVAANLLAEAGWSVTVFEQASQPGGAVRSGELTLPGFVHDYFSAFYPFARASPVLSRLQLEQHGLVWRRAEVAIAHPFADGRCAAISTDLEETAACLEAFAPDDGPAFRAMIDHFARIEGPLLDALFSPFPPLVPTARLLRRLGRDGSVALARQLLLPSRQLAAELFVGEGAGVLLAGLGLHADLPPEQSASAAYGWLLACLAQRVGFPVPEGGAGSLTRALTARLVAMGGELFCDMKVDKVLVEQERASGVVVGGESIRADAVLADVDAPSLFERLVPQDALPASFRRDLTRFQWDFATVKIDWALDGPVPWAAPLARRAASLHVADDLDNLTEYAAELAMGRLPSRPFILFGQQSSADRTRSPEGSETAWAYSRIPRVLRGDGAGEIDIRPGTPASDESFLEAYVNRLEHRIEALAPGFGRLVRARHVSSPAALEAADPNLSIGAIGGGTSQLHQQLVFRPLPGMGRPETPLAGLYLASSSAHPGGGVHGGPGANAARAAMRPAPRLRAALFGRGGRTG